MFTKIGGRLVGVPMMGPDTGGGSGGGSQKTAAEIIQEELKGIEQKFKDALDKHEKEVKENGTASKEAAAAVKEQEAKYEALLEEFKGVKDSVNGFAKKFGRPGADGQAEEIKSAGELFVSNDKVKQMIANGEPQRGVPIAVKSFHTKALTSATTGAGNGGVLPGPYRAPLTVEQPQRRLTIRDLLNVTPITTNAVEYVREVGFTNNAAIRPEGAAAAESVIEFALETAGVKNIAHWMPASREILADAPRLRSFIDNRMVYGVESKEEAQILYGDGLNGSLTGLMNDADVQDIGQIPADSGLNAIDWIRRAMTMGQIAEYPATGVILHPMDWEKIELAKGTDGHYLWVNIATGNGQQLFKVPVVVTTAVTEGDFLVGAFGLGATLYDREQASVRFSESHSDFFTRGMVAIMAEERLALTVERPEAFVKGKLTVAAGA